MARVPQGSLQGQVMERDTPDPIEGATVAVWSAADSSLVTGAVSRNDGRFQIEGLRRGTYYVRVSFVGYRTETVGDVTLQPGSLAADLGTIALAVDTEHLGEVEVTADRDFVEVGIDRTVYNTKDQLVSVGGSATDVLQNIPSVEVDIDGNVSLRGNQNVAILINGRPSSLSGEALTSFLQGLPADAIERVEVIPNPSARYEPDGMSGILNIVLQKDRNLGLGGSITAGGNSQGAANASGSLTYQQGRWTLFSNYGFRRGTRDIDAARFRENRFLDPLTYLEQTDAGERTSLSNMLNTSLDYELGERSTLSGNAILSYRTGGNSGENVYRELDADRALTRIYRRTSTRDRADLNMDYRLSFQHIVTPREDQLTAEVRFENEDENNDNLYVQEPLDEASAVVTERERNEQDEHSREWAAQVDYVRPLGTGKMEAGAKGSFSRLDSDFFAETFDPLADAFLPDAQLINTFAYDEDIYAAYGIVEQSLGRFSTQVGLRAEQARTRFDLRTTNETFENDYFSLFPSAFVTYALTEGEALLRTLKLSYSKRINRPNTWQLNPFDDQEDPLFRRIGNPYLSPEYAHSWEASLSQITGTTTLTMTPYFRRTVDVIRWYETVTDEGVSLLTFENLATRDSWGAEMVGTLRPFDWLNAYASFNAYKVVTDGSNVDADLGNDSYGWTTRLNSTLNLRPDLAVQLSFFYRSPIDIENGRIDSFSMSSIGVRQKLWGEKASLSLNIRDVFNTMGFQVEREDERFFQMSDRNWNAQQIGLSFTYNFGQQDRKRRRNFDGDRGGEDFDQDMQMQ